MLNLNEHRIHRTVKRVGFQPQLIVSPQPHTKFIDEFDKGYFYLEEGEVLTQAPPSPDAERGEKVWVTLFLNSFPTRGIKFMRVGVVIWVVVEVNPA